MTNNTRTIYTSATETRTFAIGEEVILHSGIRGAEKATIEGFPGGIFELRFAGAVETVLIVGGELVKALRPIRLAPERMRHGW